MAGYVNKNGPKNLTLDELFIHLRQMADNLPAWIERVDADVSDRPELWGKRAIRVVIPYGREIWLQEAQAHGEGGE